MKRTAIAAAIAASVIGLGTAYAQDSSTDMTNRPYNSNSTMDRSPAVDQSAPAVKPNVGADQTKRNTRDERRKGDANRGAGSQPNGQNAPNISRTPAGSHESGAPGHAEEQR